MSKDAPPRPQRQAVLIVHYADGYAEAFAERNIDVRIVCVPVAHSSRGEVLAEECARMMTPRRFADLWRRDLLRANGSTAPLAAETVLDALQVRDILAAYPAADDAKGAA